MNTTTAPALDLCEDSPCPMPRCKGKFEVKHEHDGGCTCFRNPPCSYCTDTYLECSECGINADIVHDLWYVFQKTIEEKTVAGQETPKDPSPFHRMPPSTAVMAAHEIWLPGIGGRI